MARGCYSEDLGGHLRRVRHWDVMSIEVKICGLKTIETLDAALEANADYIGLVFYEKSPRHVDVEMAAMIAERSRDRAKSVALFVNPDLDEAARITERVNPDIIQLHGDESPETVRRIGARLSRPIIKAVRIAAEADTYAADRYDDVAQTILFDAQPLAGDGLALPGGNGVPFDWRALDGMCAKRRFILSGGLTPENVKDAITLTGATAVDVSSGVESSPGEKDPKRIRKFIECARSARHPN